MDEYFIVKGSNLYSLPVKLPDLSGVKVEIWKYLEKQQRADLNLPILYLSLCRDDLKNVQDFASNSKEVISYLKGETLITEGQKGYAGILIDDYL